MTMGLLSVKSVVCPFGRATAELDQLVKRVDQPDNPRLDVEACFRIEMVNEGQDFTGCAPKNALNAEGNCDTSPDSQCETYVEKTLKWGYGQEVPVDNAR
ncbi:hypothetical protein QQZ08_001391 [Neonectria magnoliae]|uniref:Uncharacterized protein n=1 Tax=Neonectria magnoliae TaxID=2732573 RepID=A0ABR1IEN4_9HYPO